MPEPDVDVLPVQSVDRLHDPTLEVGAFQCHVAGHLPNDESVTVLLPPFGGQIAEVPPEPLPSSLRLRKAGASVKPVPSERGPFEAVAEIPPLHHEDRRLDPFPAQSLSGPP